MKKILILGLLFQVLIVQSQEFDESFIESLPDDIKAKSLDELREILNSLLTKIETSPNLENSADDYQKLIKVNNLIEKKFQSLSKEISNNSKSKIDEIIKNAKKTK